MNVEYIPAFYGAFSETTAVAELRPGIGDRIAIGTFILQRDLKVFDFTVFSNLAPAEWLIGHRHTRYAFIMQMEGQISRRAVPHERRRQYIPTQAVAEYIKRYLGCEAVIYRSAVIKEQRADSRNVVVLPTGASFTGGTAPLLRHDAHEIKEVDDVAYTLSADMF